ncbi:hypothetical protein F5Y16DRAFT_403974 [Xylariaceae sp. FL0255]|nr:hypothetical protein F5Y16DRAFT_403974 [Xylariaceae sp. FL0255]
MDSNTRRTTRIEIPLPLKPRDYQPGDGPPLAPVHMTLQHDTDAFIVDKRVVPGKPVNGDLKLELYYIVGWPDLPAARVAILATNILDYVSPRTLEDWEYQCLLERDAEKEKREAAERKLAQERAEARGISTPSSATPSSKRRGRPSKADLLARKLAQQASFGKDELANIPLPPASTSGPSLSTPQKKVPMTITTDAEDMEEEIDVQESIIRQLHNGGRSDDGRSDSPSSGSGEELGRPEDIAESAPPESFLPDPSSRGYAQSPLSFLRRRDPPQLDSPIPISLRTNSEKRVSSAPNSKLTKAMPVPLYEPQVRITPVPVPSYPRPAPQVPKEPHKVTCTPVPVPDHPHPPLKAKNPHHRTYTPVPVPSYVLPRGKSVVTPVPPPDLATRIGNSTLPREPTTSQGWSSFTPAGRSSRKWPAEESIDQASGQFALTPPATVSVVQRLKEQEHSKLVEDDRVWEVKRLEGDQTIEVNGQWIRQYKVRWAGNWPPDQNPTWEPEENIPETLVRSYLKFKASKFGQTPTAVSTPLLKRKYSSVAEAFEGDAEDSPPHGTSEKVSEENEEGDEHLYVTEQRSRADTQGKKMRIDPALVIELAARFGGGGGLSQSSDL